MPRLHLTVLTTRNETWILWKWIAKSRHFQENLVTLTTQKYFILLCQLFV